jgi:glycolate oxidase
MNRSNFADYFVNKLEGIVGEEWVVTDREAIEDYLVDETAPVVRPKPATDVVLVKPSNSHEVSDILKVANEEKIPVFPRGGGTGLVGSAIPVENGIVLSLERMDRIEVDSANLMVVAEAGVTLGKLIETAERANLFFPLHPGEEIAQVGGLVACNAGGARAVKYGVMRKYVTGIEIVLPTGEILNLGGKLLKNVAGYDLMHLLIGSEGTLGVITKVIIRLHPRFKQTATLIITYDNRHDAMATVPRILQEGVIPLAVEYVERELMETSAERLGKKWSVKRGKALLYIITTGRSVDEVYREADRIDNIAREYNALDTLVIQSKREQDDILSVRSNIYLSLKPHTMDILDIGVPPVSVAELLDALDGIAEEYNMYLPVYGHAADGNVHVQILMEEAGGVKGEDFEKVKEEIYDLTIGLGGTITAEHGVGKTRLRSFSQYVDKKALEIMRGIKRVFDPSNILNPGKVLP